MSRPADGYRPGDVRRYDGALGPDERDVLVVEEPLEIRYDRRAVATLMRTPGDDRELAAGYLYSEGWVDSPDAVGVIALCGAGSGASDGERNIVDVRPAPGAPPPPPGLSVRAAPATSSCGVCGKRTIEEAMALRPPARDDTVTDTVMMVSPEVLASLPERLRRAQEIFARTGALHAAGVFDARGELLFLREDIGRHNAVDKAIGEALLVRRLPLSSCVLQVSGRVSFEIVQKAYRAGIPIVSAVSGVSTLAVSLAESTGILLAGFVRDGRFSVYAHAGRLGSTGTGTGTDTGTGAAAQASPRGGEI